MRRTVPDYDPIAWFYDRYWSDHYHPWALSVLERVLLPGLSSEAAILDLCCGTGVIAGALSARGFRVTGIDASLEMLRFARVKAPAARFVCGDARTIQFRSHFHAAISTFDSLNHILSLDELGRVFRGVGAALRPGGMFVFDMNLEERYRQHWKETCSTVDDEHACFIRGGYEARTRLGETRITLFRKRGTWERRDVTMLQRYHAPEELVALLVRTGFVDVRCVDVAQELGISGTFGQGRGWFTAVRNGSTDRSSREPRSLRGGGRTC
jgi:SAM-dependent methyltransferase